jgi:hypothetical protein
LGNFAVAPGIGLAVSVVTSRSHPMPAKKATGLLFSKKRYEARRAEVRLSMSHFTRKQNP